jgi:sodium/pantothenate symporter
MTAMTIAWSLFAVYLVVTFWLAWLGHRRTKTFADFAVGGRNMGPGVAGLTLGACLASTATFVINPGFVYAYGLPALIALTIPLFLGIGAGLLVLGPGFRRLGGKATTLPVWLGQRYGSSGLRAWFAVLSLLHVFYVVLIVVGAAYVMSNTMGVSYVWAVRIVVGVVFSYVLLGGTYAHAYTNTAQAVIMLAVAVVIFWVAGDQILSAEGGAVAALTQQDPHLVGLTHPESPFYRHWLEVLVCPFVVGFSLVAQPHLLVKTLYLKRTQDMLKFGLIGFGCFIVFSLVLAAGLAGRLTLGGDLAQDVAMSRWLAGAFSPAIGAVVSVAILAAAMSTLDGLLVAISAIVGADLLSHPWVLRRLGYGEEASPELQSRLALNGGRATIVVLGVVAYTVALSPPELIGIFGTVGTYGLLVASLPAVLYGVVCKQPPTATAVFLASVVGLAVHLGLYLSGVTINTGLTASVALVCALVVPLFFRRAKTAAAPTPIRDLVASSPRAN